jgi:hypothetical protein
VVNIPQQKENLLNFLGNGDRQGTAMDVVSVNTQQHYNPSFMRSRSRVPPFFILLENHDLILHNCMVDSNATNNIMSVYIMEDVGLECTKYYEVGEIIYAIDSIKVLAYGEIKDFFAWIISKPHIKTIFTIIVVDLPITYNVV